MAKDNKTILLSANAEIDRGNPEGFLAFCAEDLEWTAVGEFTLRGKQAVRQWMATAYAEPPEYTVEHLVGEGDFVTAIGEIRTRGEDGTAVRNAYCDVWRFRDGKMVALQAFVIPIAA
jgi:uncharacterized protein